MQQTVTLGYTIFYVADVGATLAFYGTAFGFPTRMLTPEGDYGELDTGATVLAFVDNGLADSNLSTAGGFTALDPLQPPPGMNLTLVTAELAATFASAIEAGARAYVEPVEKPWGQTVAYVLDPNGVLIEIATPISA